MKKLALFALAALATSPAIAQQPLQWRYSFENNVATATYPGNVKVQGQIITVPADCDATGSSDATACLNSAMSAFGTGGGTLKIQGQYRVLGTLTVPVGVSIQGKCEMPGSPGLNASAPYQNYSCGVFKVASSATISMSSGSNLSHALIYRDGMTFPAQNGSAFAGTAITANGDDVSLYAVQVMGFEKAFYSLGFQRARIQYMYGDNNNNIEIANALDVVYISNSHFWPFASIAATGGDYTNLTRSGSAIYLHDTVDWAHITDTFSYGYFRGIRLSGVNNTSIIGSGADNVYDGNPLFTNSIGLLIEGNSRDTRVFGFQAAAQQSVGVYVNTTVGNATYLRDTTVWGGSQHGVLVEGGDVMVQGGLIGNSVPVVNAVSVNNSASRVFVNGVKFGAGNAGIINNATVSSNIQIGANDYSGFVTNIATNTVVTPNIASAAALVIPNNGSLFNVTGTTGVTSLGQGWAGRCITLTFTGVLNVSNSTGSITAIRLSGGVAFATTVGATLSLCHNGGQWYEVGRSS